MTTPETSPATAKPGMPPWAKKAIGIAVMAVVLVIAYFILAAFLALVGAAHCVVGERQFQRRNRVGAAVRSPCAPWSRSSSSGRSGRCASASMLESCRSLALALGVIFALPNLLSLTVVLGNNNAAHAGERILDVDGPGFRGASVVGAVLGVALFLGLVALGYMYKKRGKDLDKMRGELKQHEPQSKGEAPAPEI